MVKTVFFVLIFLGAVSLRGELQFVGMMSSSQSEYFAVREKENQRAEWVTKGGSVGAYVVTSYDSKNGSLTLKKGSEILVLHLPESRVRMVQDEIVTGLGKILNFPTATRMVDLLHPKLRPLYDGIDFSSSDFADLQKPGTTAGIRELNEEEQKVFDRDLTTIGEVTGSRPKKGFWIRTAKSWSMTFVVEVGESFYLAPGVGWPPKE